MYSQTTPTAGAQLNQRRSATAITVDNLLRRRLNVSDPHSASDIADGLRRTFVLDSQAERRETTGLPTVPMLPMHEVACTAGPSGVEVTQATDDVDRDLRALIANSQLKDIEAELEGWSQAIRANIADGLSAAKLALDPRARDKAFGARRTLGDYARMARLIGTMTPSFSQPYRRLAQSLDEVSAMILVSAGESLATLGLGSGRALLPAPASELSARRDAALAALRALAGATENSFSANGWSYGLFGLRESLRRLEEAGHSDLRALLDQNTLAQLMDDLIDRASTTTARSLRALGATGQVTIQRLQRLISVLSALQQNTALETPPVANFLIALQLFVDGFAGQANGYRLLYVARPPLVFYGMYGLGEMDLATRRLFDVVSLRGQLAELLDCYLGCDCCGPENVCQGVLDHVLYATDRAIDLLLVGTDPAGKGKPEQRAAAYGWLIREFVIGNCESAPNLAACLNAACSPSSGRLRPVLKALGGRLLEAYLDPEKPLDCDIDLPPQEEREVMSNELCLQSHAEARWEKLVTSMAPSCTAWAHIHDPISKLLQATRQALGVEGDCPEPEISIPPTMETSTAGIAYKRSPSGRYPALEPPGREPGNELVTSSAEK
jgi:hypothetical protein